MSLENGSSKNVERNHKLDIGTDRKHSLVSKRISDGEIDKKQMKILNYFEKVERRPPIGYHITSSDHKNGNRSEKYADIEELVSQLVGAMVLVEKLKLSDYSFHIDENSPTDSDSDPLYKVAPLKTSIFNMMVYYCLKCNKQYLDAEASSIDRDKRNCEVCKKAVMFQCLRCDARYSNLADAKHHLESKCNPIEFYDCSYCTFNCSIKSKIYEHLQNAHANVYESSRSTGGTSSFDYGEGVAFVKKLRFNVMNMAKRYCLNCDERMDLRVKSCEKCDNIPTTLQCLKCNKVCPDSPSMKYHLESACNSMNSFQCTRCQYICNVKQLIKRHCKKCHERERSADAAPRRTQFSSINEAVCMKDHF